MSRLMLGSICGLVWGALSAASMIPLQFDDKRAALLGAFLNRFAIGFVIGAARLPLPNWASGLVFGLLLSLPDAIITKAYVPIIGLGAVVGVIVGVIVGKWGR
jgi:sorbitol-specific phosphotransferase system component IIBC